MANVAVATETEFPPKQMGVIAAALLGLVAVAYAAGENGPVNRVLAVFIGGFAGFALYHASFGFTAAWRRIVTERRGNGLRAQMILIGITCCMSFLLIDYGRDITLNLFGTDWNLRTNGFVNPWGVGSAIGAFIFGFGMMFGGGCASGTLFTSGGGSSRMIITLFFFIMGSVIATHHLGFWTDLPRFGGFSFVREFGAPTAIAIFLLILGTIYLGSIFIEKKTWGELEGFGETKSFWQGPWSKLAGAIALIAVSVGTLLVLHRPWGITSGFALWGAKMFYAVGIPVETWDYWSGGRLRSLTDRSVFANSTSIMNFGIIFGAMLAAGLAGKYKPQTKIKGRDIFTAVMGGLLMGYGARLAYGCNIGAYLGGLVSGSMHGWWWLIFGFAGSVLGIKTKARFGL